MAVGSPWPKGRTGRQRQQKMLARHTKFRVEANIIRIVKILFFPYLKRGEIYIFEIEQNLVIFSAGIGILSVYLKIAFVA